MNLLSASAQMNATTPTAEDPAQPTVRLERRRTNRFCTELLVRLCWQDSTGHVFDAPGVIRNISADGFGLECSQSLPIDQLVTVRTAAASLECVVRHAELASKGFLIGVQVLPPSRFRMKGLEKLSVALSVSQEKPPTAIVKAGEADAF